MEGTERLSEVSELLAGAVKALADAIRQFGEALAAAIRPVLGVITSRFESFIDAALWAVATGREWHLYKHARKYRTRLKYRRRLFLRLAE